MAALDLFPPELYKQSHVFRKRTVTNARGDRSWHPSLLRWHPDQSIIPAQNYYFSFSRYPKYAGQRKEVEETLKFFKVTAADFSAYLPAVLSEKAAFKDFAKYFVDKPHIPMPPKMIVANQMIIEHFSQWMHTLKEWSYEECMMHLNYATSPGLPWTLEQWTKAGLVEHPKFIEYYTKYRLSLETANPNPTFFSVALKEELREAQKIRDEKTRTINAAPLEHTMACLQDLGDLQEQFNRMPLEGGHFAAFSPYFGGWDQYVKYMMKFKYSIEYDFSQYDSSIRLFFFFCFYDFINAFLPPEDFARQRRVFNLIMQAAIAYCVLPNGDVFIKLFGNATGWFLTFLFNCFVNLLISFLFHIEHRKNNSLKDYYSWFRIMTCGDDNHQTTNEPYDVNIYVKLCAELGMILEPDGTWKDPLTSVFVSRHTVLWHNMYVSYGNISKMWCSLFYNFTQIDIPTVINKLCAIRRDMYFSKDLYNKITDYILYLLLRMKNDPSEEMRVARSQFDSDRQILYLHTGQRLPGLPDVNFEF